MAGCARRLMVEARQTRRLPGSVLLLSAVLLAPALHAQTLYKFRGADGEWIYADRPPPDGKVEEMRDLGGEAKSRQVRVTSSSDGATLSIVAENPFYIPVELALNFTRLEGLTYPDPDKDLEWVLPPRSRTPLLSLNKRGDGSVPAARYTVSYRYGDPGARQRTDAVYRAPFAVSSQYPVTQAYPDVVTHRTEDSRYAVDIAMPIGTDIFAAREGIVFDVSSDNFRNGLDPERDGPSANVVQVLHDDGTYAVYAHLNWNSIRVRPGDRVARGQYIADSGNTGFSSGPHLHFVVLRNAGMRTVSVPLSFEGADRTTIVPASGTVLTAY
jgi:murein DD-endopeptidase MepM/ murein hydrolase activator NlpD